MIWKNKKVIRGELKLEKFLQRLKKDQASKGSHPCNLG